MNSLSFYNLDDYQFRLTLTEFKNEGTINFDPDRLTQLQINLLVCVYSSCLQNMLLEEKGRLNLNCSSLESGLSFLHVNIRGISNKS